MVSLISANLNAPWQTDPSRRYTMENLRADVASFFAALLTGMTHLQNGNVEELQIVQSEINSLGGLVSGVLSIAGERNRPDMNRINQMFQRAGLAPLGFSESDIRLAFISYMRQASDARRSGDTTMVRVYSDAASLLKGNYNQLRSVPDRSRDLSRIHGADAERYSGHFAYALQMLSESTSIVMRGDVSNIPALLKKVLMRLNTEPKLKASPED
jgi:hypothetical protein